MTKQTEAMKLALEALEVATTPLAKDRQEVLRAQAAIREALAEQPAQQEPVGRLESDPYEGHVFVPRIDGDWSMLGKDLYTAPPAQRTWVGLTDDEAEDIWNRYCDEMGEASINDVPDIARAIESALRSKNT